jgi:hypothetical protein
VVAQESVRGQIALGPDVGFVARPAKGSSTSGASYGAGLAWGLHGQILAARWLRVSAFYLHASQPVTLDPGALGVTSNVSGGGDLRSYLLGARLQPTWNPTSRVHVWASVGAAWGRLAIGEMQVEAPSRYTLPAREGVMVEVPLGVGGMVDVVPRWLGVGLDATWGPTMSQSGDVFSSTRGVDGNGRVQVAGGLPTIASSTTVLASISLEL